MNKVLYESLVIDTEMRFVAPELQDLLDYWTSKCNGRRMPARADIDPLEMKPHLGRLVLTDVLPATPQSRFRYRLVGATVCEYLGRDSTGRYLDELYGRGYEYMIVGYRWILEHRRPIRVTGDLRHANRQWARLESVELPLSADGETVNMIMTRSAFS